MNDQKLTHVAVALRNAVAIALILLPLTAAASAAEVPARPSGGKGGKYGTFPAAKIEVGNEKREFRLVAPESAFADGPAPLVFAYHGFLDSKDLMALYTQLDKVAKKEGFMLVYPNARHRHWPLVPGLEKDDLAFHDTLYAKLMEKYNLDRNRVYLTGMSNGAYFIHMIARQRSGTIAAIAPHSGGVGSLWGNPLRLENKYAVLAIHGDKDTIVKPIESQRTREYYEKWKHPVELMEVDGLGHFWAHKADVNEKMWEFFEEHPLEGE